MINSIRFLHFTIKPYSWEQESSKELILMIWNLCHSNLAMTSSLFLKCQSHPSFNALCQNEHFVVIPSICFRSPCPNLIWKSITESNSEVIPYGIICFITSQPSFIKIIPVPDLITWAWPAGTRPLCQITTQ